MRHPCLELEAIGLCSNERPILADYSDVINTLQWLMVLSSTPLYRSLGRTPISAHLVELLNIYLEYVAHDGRYRRAEFEGVPYERRGPLAGELRALLAAWAPPELPNTIKEAARGLLYAEGLLGPEGDWDNLMIVDPVPVEEMLLWPEGVPALLR